MKPERLLASLLLVSLVGAAPAPEAAPPPPAAAAEPAWPEGAIWCLSVRDPGAVLERALALAGAAAGDEVRAALAREASADPAVSLLKRLAPGRAALLFGFGPGEGGEERLAAAVVPKAPAEFGEALKQAGVQEPVGEAGDWRVVSSFDAGRASVAAFLARGPGPGVDAEDDFSLRVSPADLLEARRREWDGFLDSISASMQAAPSANAGETRALVEGARRLLGDLPRRVREVRIGARLETSGLTLRLAAFPAAGRPFPVPAAAGPSRAARALPAGAPVYASLRLPEAALDAIASALHDPASADATQAERMLRAMGADQAYAMEFGESGFSGTSVSGVRDEAAVRKLLADASGEQLRQMETMLSALGGAAKVESRRSARKSGDAEVQRLELHFPGLEEPARSMLDGIYGVPLVQEWSVGGGYWVSSLGKPAPERLDGALKRLREGGGELPAPLAEAARRHGEDCQVLVAVPLLQAVRDGSALARRALVNVPFIGGIAFAFLPGQNDLQGEDAPLTGAVRLAPDAFRAELRIPAAPVRRIIRFFETKVRQFQNQFQNPQAPAPQAG